MSNKADVDPRLVRIEHALDDHALLRRNSVDPEDLKRANRELGDVLNNSTDEIAVDEYLKERTDKS